MRKCHRNLGGAITGLQIRGRSSGLNRSAARKFAVPIEAVSRTAGVKYGRVSLSYKLEVLLKSHFGAVD